jgi:hypothetical protein
VATSLALASRSEHTCKPSIYYLTNPFVGCRRRGDAAAPGGDPRAGSRAAGEQRRGGEARRCILPRGRRRELCADGAGEPVGADGGDGRGAAEDGRARPGRRRQRWLRLYGGCPVLPTIHRLHLHQTVGKLNVMCVARLQLIT